MSQATGNLFLDKSAAFVTAAVQMDKHTDDAIKALRKEIDTARNAERTALEVLAGMIDTHQAIPTIVLIDGTECNDPNMIKTDINVRTTLKVKSAEAKIDAMYKAAHGTPSEQLSQKTVDTAAKAGVAVGKALNTPWQALKQFVTGFKTNSAATINTSRQNLLQL